MFFCHLDETITAEGQIRPKATEATIKTKFSGVVTEVFFTNSQHINKNDILLTQDCRYEREYLRIQKNLKNLYERYMLNYQQLQTLIDNVTTENFSFQEEIKKKNPMYSDFTNQYKNELNSKKNIMRDNLFYILELFQNRS